MKTFVFAITAVFCGIFGAAAQLPQTGFYQTIDDETNTPKSIVVLYNYDNDALAGRIVALYGANGKIAETIEKPVHIATNVDGAPYFVGLDIIWNMHASGDKYTDGKIMDPKSGRVYSSAIWMNGDGKLNVRGKIGPFGRTQQWNTMPTDALPAQLQNIDITNWTPTIRD